MLKLCVFVGAAAAASCSVSAQQVFSSDFESDLPAQVSGPGVITPTQGYNAFGFGAGFLRNSSFGDPAAPIEVTITNLPAHDSVSLDFLLAVIDSWDSDNGSPAPDYFNVSVDDVPVFQATFANASGGAQYNPPAGGLLIDNGSLGFNSYVDDAFDLAFEPAVHNIAHTASSVTVRFFASGAGWQGGDDESFAIDNLSISVSSVPAPAAGALASLALFAAARRRRN